MDRHEAYELLARTLASYRLRPFAELAAQVGSTRSERVRTQGGQEFLLDVSIAWDDRCAGRLRIVATVDSPSTFRLERLQESILVTTEGRGPRPEA